MGLLRNIKFKHKFLKSAQYVNFNHCVFESVINCDQELDYYHIFIERQMILFLSFEDLENVHRGENESDDDKVYIYFTETIQDLFGGVAWAIVHQQHRFLMTKFLV
jgi:hypothetical protein